MKLGIYNSTAAHNTALEQVIDQPLLGSEMGEGQQVSTFNQYLYSLKRHWVELVIFCGCSMLVCYIVSKRITPVFESTAVLEFNHETPAGVVGQDAMRSDWNDSDQFIATQMKVIQEDSVLRPLAQRYNLEDGQGRNNAPVKLKQLRVTRPANTYLVQISYRSTDPALAAVVANGVADSYLKHIFRSRLEDSRNESSFMERQLDELRASMERSSMAVSDFERRLGVIDPQQKTDILSARLMQLNTEYTTAQADRIRKEADYGGTKSGSLAAAQQSDQGDQLKGLQQALNEARRKFTDIKSHYGTSHPEYTREASLIAELQSQLNEAKNSVAGRTEVAYQDAQQRESILKHELSEAKTAYDNLNSQSFQYQSLKAEAETNRKLYNDLEQRIKEAGINADFQNSSTHVSDPARPAQRPLYPVLPLNLGLTFAFSLLLGVAGVLLYDAADDKLQDLSQITNLFHIDILGTIPSFEGRGTTAPARSIGTVVPIKGVGAESSSVASAAPVRNAAARRSNRYSQFQEAIKMLWSSFQLTNYGNKCRSLMVTSAISGEGKTTISLQFALANARRDRKTLLIDADLRRPSAHRDAEVQVSPGVADAIDAPEKWPSYIQVSPLNPNLHILSAGLARHGSVDNLIRLIPHLIGEAEQLYDLVLVDTPPLLSFAESLHIATVTDGVMIVVCSGKTSRSALRSVLQTLSRLRCPVTGIVFNRVQLDQADTHYSYKSYSTHDLEVSA